MRARSLTANRDCQRPPATSAYPTIVSSASAPEEPLDVLATHAIEVLRYGDLTRHEAKPLHARPRRRAEGHDLDERLARFRDDERFALCGLVDQSGQLSL